MDRSSFTVPDELTWKQLSIALNQKYLTMCDQGLTPDNLHYLGEKVLRQEFSNQIPDDILISWASFFKNVLPANEFTFWEWFYDTIRLTRDHLRRPWREGHILGFCNKKKIEEMLQNSPAGMFMLRFSESAKG